MADQGQGKEHGNKGKARKGHPNSHPRFTHEQRERVIGEVHKLHLRGYNQYQIAEKVGISQPQVCQYLKDVRDGWREAYAHDHDTWVNQQVSRYLEVAREAWEAWERSKEDARKKVTESTPPREPKGKGQRDGSNPRVKRGGVLVSLITETGEGRLPDVSYLRVIQECLKAIREVRGLDAPRKVDPNAPPLVNMNWDLLFQTIPDGPVPNLVEAQLQKVLGETTQGLPSHSQQSNAVNGELNGQGEPHE